FFGKQTDLVRESLIEDSMSDLTINDISYRDRTFTFGLKREKDLGIGDKLQSDSGEVKLIGKDRVSNIAEMLEEAHIRGGGKITPELKKMFGSIDVLATGEALKHGLTDRTASSLIYSAEQKAIEEGSTEL